MAGWRSRSRSTASSRSSADSQTKVGPMNNQVSRRSLLASAAGLAAASALPRFGHADWRPTEAVRIIVPAAPGGTTDVMGRLLAQHLQVAWGQSTVVENKSGGV